MKKIIKLLFLVSWLATIYYLSSQNGELSGDLSNSLLYKVGVFFNVSDPANFVLQYESLFRKFAHFSEYCILGFLLYLTLIEFVHHKTLLLTIVLCVIYAISDEIHQLYVVGRVFAFVDIVIDSIGAYCGSSFIHLLYTECFRGKKH